MTKQVKISDHFVSFFETMSFSFVVLFQAPSLYHFVVYKAIYVLKGHSSGLHGSGSIQDTGHYEMCKGYKDNSVTTF